MVVEDEQIFHDLYEVMLENTGYGITSVYDGYEALSKLEEKKPDLIITDVVLNMTTGDTLFLYLKSMPEYADIPVIVVSSYPEHAYKNLKQVDQNLVYLEKAYLTKERLLEEIDKKLIEQVEVMIG